jgi:serine/threonine protein kinase
MTRPAATALDSTTSSATVQVHLLIESWVAGVEEDSLRAISLEAKDLLWQMLQEDPSHRPNTDDVLNHPWLVA